MEGQISLLGQQKLHFLLLSYYRLLQANPTLPKYFSWPVSTLAKIFATPEIDSGARLLATRCYFLQSGMGEAERMKLEQLYVGDVGTIDCPISYSINTDGSMRMLDGWVLPAVEATRVTDFWRSTGEDAPNYHSETEGARLSISQNDLRCVILSILTLVQPDLRAAHTLSMFLGSS